ncbi:MAG TPA: tRNA (N(6)-L-threonylcarbamoyladenosine(37)-C(2))-methylthiotransferase MtaB [Bacteroidales bacterium]|nr:tRNA (N(6)-L-threonylcarbamoyladenosine(37)-C(2))-methylthiotransferase MtaB [Bacteroidales bacterium]
MHRTVAFRTLGCRLNQYETDALASAFDKDGYSIVELEDEADVVIINTCTVTNQSDRKSRQVMNQAIRRDTDHRKLIIMTGCSVNNHKEALGAISGVSYLVENGQKSQILNIVNSHFRGEMVDPSRLPEDLFGFAAAERTFHTRSIIKIQDGCDNFCTFCIIPEVRGRAVSRPLPDILENIRQVLDFGFKEVVLTGVNIGRYDFDGHNFDDLVEKVLALPGDFRVRISSIEPDGFGDKLYRLFQHPKLAPHMHLCLQSGSERILLQMRRMYTARRFREITDKIRRQRPDFNFTTDIIVGFPGETEADLMETVEFAREIGFSHIHTFKYSKRHGTRAERMPDQLTEAEKNRRSEIIRLVSEENKRKYRESMLGKTQRVIVEKVENGMAMGYGEHYIPVAFPARGLGWNEWASVKLWSLDDGEDPTVRAKMISDI